MDLYSFAPIAAVLDGAYSIVAAIASLLDPVAGPASAAVAVILITLLVRAALIPVGVSQVRAEFSRRRIAPKLRELQRKHKNNPELLQRKMRELYAAENASPVAGCLPTLLQAPVISTVYGLFILPAINGHPNALLTEQLFGVPLGSSLLSMVGAGLAWADAAVFLVLLGVIAVVSWGSRVVALRQAAAIAAVGTGGADPTPPAMQNVASALSWLPFLTVVFAAIVPLAAALYLTVTTAWTLGERVLLRRLIGRRS